MGLSIHYSGSFKQDASLEEMIEEVKDIVEMYNWEYNSYETHFSKKTFGQEVYDDKLYGISFTPPNCETISLTFLSNGKMCCGFKLNYLSNSDKADDKKYLYMLSTKTQYAGSTIHKIIIHLFKYLSKKYFQHFELIDEGHYWETEDEAILEMNFKIYNALIDGFEQSLNNYPIENSESFTAYFYRIMKIVDAKRKKK